MTNIIFTDFELSQKQAFFSGSEIYFGEVDIHNLRIILSSVSHTFSLKHLKLVHIHCLFDEKNHFH